MVASCRQTARATGPSLGTILFSSLLTTILQTISTILRSFTRFLRQSSLPTFLAPLSYLIPICDFLAEWANWFNGYTTVYAALTGKGASDSAGDVARVLFANRGANIRDSEHPIHNLFHQFEQSDLIRFARESYAITTFIDSDPFTTHPPTIARFLPHAFFVLPLAYIWRIRSHVCSVVLGSARLDWQGRARFSDRRVKLSLESCRSRQ